ncbi:unnamed protein product [Bursaphelenchus okinawaensis]|uniref:Uncharacterized protein n=1 Tax=Bursaphelenchus okinawaensis TaxID=465554 RepID=A0A811KK52_9BILA|nr:unnamed protein product [Bursaphelenchus okinawaensis]CAG9105370.1 unnamed protein product [Bursaphelenchus okinawaensis]
MESEDSKRKNLAVGQPQLGAATQVNPSPKCNGRASPWRRHLLDRAALPASYKLMILLGTFHLIGLQTGGLLAAIFMIRGSVFCDAPLYHYICAAVDLATWYVRPDIRHSTGPTDHKCMLFIRFYRQG